MASLPLEALLDRARDCVREVLIPDADAIDREARWPKEQLHSLQEAGLGGLVAPSQAGGQGQGLLGLARVSEVLAQGCSSTAMCFAMHCVGTAAIAAKPTEDQGQRYLRPIAEGGHLTTIALSEPGTGAHFWLPQTKLRRSDDGRYVLDGTKTFVTNGGYADSYVVSTVAGGEDAQPGDFSCVVVPAAADGLVWGPAWTGLGMRGNSARGVELKGVRVPEGDLLGQEGDEIWYVFNVVAPYFLIGMAGVYLGIATSAFEFTLEHMKQRRYSHTGATLSQQSVLQHRVGVLWSRIEMTRRLIYEAAFRGDKGHPDALQILASAKAEVAVCVVDVVNECMTLTGGITYRDGSRLERLLRDGRAAPVMSPTTDILRTWAGRAALGLPLVGE